MRSHCNIKQRIISFLHPADVLSKSRVFLEWFVILIAKLLVVILDLENEIEQLSSSSDIEG